MEVDSLPHPTIVLWKRRWFVLFAAHALQLAFLLWIAAHAKVCCDVTDYYIPAGRSIIHDGLLWQDPYAGYRFYFVPMVFGLLEEMLGAFGRSASIVESMPFALAGMLCLMSLLASSYIACREGMRRWAMFAIPLLFNPFVLAVVPYALQESVVVIFCMPLLFVLLARRQQDFRWTCIVAGLFASIVFVARSSLVWVALPALLFVACQSSGRNFRTILQGAALAFVVSIALIWPQCYISWQKFGTLNPLSQTAVGQSQIAYGVEMLHFSATFTEGKFSPFTIWSPYHELPLSEQNSAFYLNHPKEGLFLVITHVWSGLHYVAVVPYIPEADISIVNLWLLGSAVIVCFGALGLPRLFVPGERGAALMLAGLTILSCVYTAFVATENRFGLIGFAALSVAGWQLVTNPDERGFCLRALPLVIVYAALCVAFNALLLYRTSLPWPNNEKNTERVGASSPGLFTPRLCEHRQSCFSTPTLRTRALLGSATFAKAEMGSGHATVRGASSDV